MNKLCTLAVVLVSLVGPIGAQKKATGKCGITNEAEICKLPQMTADPSYPGYVEVIGEWSPKLSDGMEINITCVRSTVPQLSNSKLGVCILAAGGLSMTLPTVRMDAFGVISWGQTQIVAQSSEEQVYQECEKLTYVVDFRSNTVTLTDTLDKTTERCTERWKSVGSVGKPKLPTVSVFHLVHAYATLYANPEINKFLAK